MIINSPPGPLKQDWRWECGVAAGCSTAGSGGSAAPHRLATHMVAPVDGKLVVGLANGWAGNSWRSQMVAEFKYAAENKYADDISRTIITDANQSVDQQISQINDMISAGANLILIDATSSSALTGVVQRAQEAGIQVVSFDNAVESEYNIICNTSAEEFGQIGGEWLAMLSSVTRCSCSMASGTPIDFEPQV